MKQAAGIEAYASDPVGSYLAGRSFLHWYASDRLLGFVLWGRPDEQDIRHLTRALDVEMRPGACPHESLVDARRLEGVDANAFQALIAFLEQRWARLGEVKVRQALIRPSSGLAGTVTAGFYEVHTPTYPVRVFADPAEALSWLEHPTRELLREIDEIQAQVAGTPPVVLAVREAIEARLAQAELASVARALGMSERTLQRRLSEAGTSFIGEHNAARLRIAQTLLLDTDMKLTAIAAHVGCASLQHLSKIFRKQTGQSPGAWREARRRGTEAS